MGEVGVGRDEVGGWVGRRRDSEQQNQEKEERSDGVGEVFDGWSRGKQMEPLSTALSIFSPFPSSGEEKEGERKPVPL